MTQKEWVGIFLRAGIVVGITIALYYLLYFTIPLLYPFLIGWFLAMLMEPGVAWIEKKLHLPRWAGVSIILFLILGLIFSLLIFLVAELVVELTNLAKLMPKFLNQGNQLFYHTFIQENSQLHRMIETVQSHLQNYPKHKSGIQESIQDNLSSLAEKGTAVITDILSGIGNFLSNLPFLLMVIVFITLATYFIGLDWPRFQGKIKEMLPDRLQKTSSLISSEIKRAIFGFLRAQLTLITITAIIMLIGLFVLNIPYAFTIALFVGLVDLLPYLGVGTILIPWVIYLFFVHNYYWAIGLSITYLIILVVRQALEPKLVASNVGLDPLLTLIALFVGFKLFGIIGLILGPIITVILIALHRASVFQDIWNYIVKGELDAHANIERL